tara:strand:+ start:528 stop:779 length:252 start_codon:yes stop_codon:yes gene_type:complete
LFHFRLSQSLAVRADEDVQDLSAMIIEKLDQIHLILGDLHIFQNPVVDVLNLGDQQPPLDVENPVDRVPHFVIRLEVVGVEVH